MRATRSLKACNARTFVEGLVELLRTEGQENPRTVETQSFQMRNVRVPAADMTEPSTKTPKERLREIKNFFEEGLIDEIEYKREKKAVLNENRKR